MTERDDHNTHGVPGGDAEPDEGTGEALDLPDLTDDQGLPLDNPSGG